jgi:hypothetical protein
MKNLNFVFVIIVKTQHAKVVKMNSESISIEQLTELVNLQSKLLLKLDPNTMSQYDKFLYASTLKQLNNLMEKVISLQNKVSYLNQLFYSKDDVYEKRM